MYYVNKLFYKINGKLSLWWVLLERGTFGWSDCQEMFSWENDDWAKGMGESHQVKTSQSGTVRLPLKIYNS